MFRPLYILCPYDSTNAPTRWTMNVDRHYLKVCRPAFVAAKNNLRIPNGCVSQGNNPLFEIIVGEVKDKYETHEYGRSAIRIVGSRHTVISWDGYKIALVEECHHDNSILDELYAAVCVLADMDNLGKRALVDNSKPEIVREIISKHFDYVYHWTMEDELFTRKFSPMDFETPPLILAEFLRIAKEHGMHKEAFDRITKPLNDEKTSELAKSIVQHAPDLSQLLLPYII